MRWVVFLSADGIEVRDKPGKKNEGWKWGPDLVKNQEIIDPARWEKEAEELWQRAGVKGKAIVVLNKDLIFDKEMGEKGDEAGFWSEVPVEKEKMGTLVVNRGVKKWLVAVDKTLYETVVGSLQKRKVGVVAVVPVEEGKDWKGKSFLKAKEAWVWWPTVAGLGAAAAIVIGAWWWEHQNSV